MKRESKSFLVSFLMPALAMYIVFVIGPLFASAIYSLTRWDGVSARAFIGLDNFQTLFVNANFWTSVQNTAVMVVLSVVFQIPLGLILAYLLSRNTRGYKVFRALLFLPVVISPIAVGIMFKLFYNSEIGLLNGFLSAIGLPGLHREWLSDPKLLLYMVIVPQVWQYIGLHVVILFAALQSLPEEVFESAVLDGASAFRIFKSISVPMIKKMIGLSTILCVTGSMKAFDHPWIMTQGGPGYRSSYMTVYMYRTAFFEGKFGYGSAIAIMIILFSLVFTILYNRLVARSEEEY